MSAVLVAGVLLIAVLADGAALGSWLGGGRRDLALGAVVFLALWLVVVTGVSEVWGFAPIAAALVWMVLGAGAWCARRRPEPGAFASDGDGWRPELRLLAVVAVALVLPLLWLPVPLDTDAQGFGQLALAVRDGGNLTTLAPLRPGIAYLYSPGGPVLFAALSAALPGVALSDVMMGAGHALMLLFVALAGSLGEELARGFGSGSASADGWPRPETWRRVAQLGAAASPGLWAALLDAHYTAILGLTIGMAGLVLLWRAWRTGSRRLGAWAGVVLAALLVAHQDCALAVALGLVPFAIAAWGAARPGERRRVGTITLGAVAVATLLLVPWLLAIAPLLATGIGSPFRTGAGLWRQMVGYQGVAWPLLALAGAVVGLRRRPAWTLAAVAWVALLVEFSVTGVLAGIPPIRASLHRFAYPFSLAWHGPVIPYLALGTVAVASWAGRHRWRVERIPGWRAALLGTAVLAVGGLAAPWLATLVAGRAPIYGALASANDVRAMRWLQRHAPAGARVLNYPGDLPGRRDWEAHWAPVLTERDCVYFRMQPFFLDDPRSPQPGALAAARREQADMVSFWRDPAGPRQAARLAAAGIRYVLVPEAVADPSSLRRCWRGRPPVLLDGRPPPPLVADSLRPVFRAGGAAVYELDGRR